MAPVYTQITGAAPVTPHALCWQFSLHHIIVNNESIKVELGLKLLRVVMSYLNAGKSANAYTAMSLEVQHLLLPLILL